MRTWKTEAAENILTLPRQNPWLFQQAGEPLFQVTKCRSGKGKHDSDTFFWAAFAFYHFKAVLCVHSSTHVLREVGSCLQARMGENKVLVRKVSSLLGRQLPCSWVFNSVNELAQ